MADIRTKVILEVDNSQLNKDINTSLNQAGNKAKSTASKTGTQLGTTLGRALGAAFSAAAAGALISFGNQAVQAFRQIEIAQNTLTGSVQAYANRQIRAKEVLQDTTASYEEKALAIGFNVDQIFEETKATDGLSNSSRQLQRQIELQERAFRDATRATEQSIEIKGREAASIQRQINLIRRETAERVKLRREQLGGDILDDELRQLNVQKDILEVTKAEADLAGDSVLAQVTQNQISALNLEIKLREEKIDVIDNETREIEKQSEVQEEALQSQADLLRFEIDTLRAELSAAQNKFDIDIEPARRKLEDLQAAAGAAGGIVTKTISEEFQNAIDEALSADVINVEETEAAIRSSIEDLYQTLGKEVGVGRQTLIQGVADLQLAGLNDPALITSTLEDFVKIASQGTLPLSQGIAQLTQQFRTENAALGERAGLTDEYASQIGPRGLAILQAEGELRGKNFDQLTREERALAKAAGLRQNSEAAQAGFNAKLESGAFVVDRNRLKLEELTIALGEDLNPAFIEIQETGEGVLDTFLLVTESIPGLAGGLFGLTVITTALGASFLALGGPVTLVITGIIALLAGLTLAWQNNSGNIQQNTEAVGKTFERVGNEIVEIFQLLGINVEDFGDVLETLQTIVGTVFGFIGNTIVRAFERIGNVVENTLLIFKGLIKFFKGDFKGGLTDVFSGIAGIIIQPFVDVGNAVIDTINGLIDGFNELPGPNLDKIDRFDASKIKESIQSFETGGFPQGVNAVVQTNENGQEYIANSKATNALSTFFNEVGKDFGQSNIDNSDNRSYTQNNYGGVSTGSFSPSFVL